MTAAGKALSYIAIVSLLIAGAAEASIPRETMVYSPHGVGPQLQNVDDRARKHDFSWNGYGGANTELPATSTSTEDATHRQTWSLGYDTLGQTTHAGIDGKDFSFEHHFDESGNVTSSKTPARRGETTYDHDARSFTTAEHLPGTANPNKYEPDASGVLKSYTDPTGEPTKVTNDGLGRPVHREYPDGTFEEIHYEGARVDWTRDRQNREQQFAYDDSGRLYEVTNAGTNAGSVVLDHIDFENGRVVRWTTPDASIEFSNFDLDNHPQVITQHRLDANGSEIDTYTITHSWNAAGELMRTEMPSYQGMNAGARWAIRLEYTHDANGNVQTILRNGLALMDANFRSAGRPITRNLTLPNGATLGRAYDYDDANGSVGRLSGMRVTVGATLFAGSSITFEGFQRKSEQLLGLSGGARFTNYDYDDRGRVKGSVVATMDPNAIPLLGIPGASTVSLTPADFRNSLDRTVAKTSDTPSTLTSESPRKGHKVATITHGANTESILYQGSGGEEVSVRTDDARYHYDFDEKEHLRSITERLIPNGTQSRLIRVRFAFDGFGRIVGRRVEVASVSNGQPPSENNWTLATPDVVASQPLPAATTFVWDPVTDNLVAIFVEGASRNGTTLANGGLLRQFIHGGMGMDDPIEVVTADARLFPIFDEAGAGTLQAVIGESGQLLARGLTADPYGEEQITIAAPAIDEVKIAAKKDSSGNLTQVAVTMHATEPLDPNTITAGTRLAAINANGTLVRTAAVTPTQPDPYTVTWTLPATDWTALTTNAAAISVAATSSLRSTTYGIDVPILPATADMQSNGTVFSTATLPIEIREPIATIQTQFTTTGTDTPFTLPTLNGLGTTTSTIVASLIISPFQALPFIDPMTGQVNARERWYDPRTGLWLTPDPLGYQDSSNLYAFAGGDPVNHRDPTGMTGDSDLSDDRRAIAAKRLVEATADRRAADAAAMQRANDLHRAATQRMIALRRMGLDVKANDIVFLTPDFENGVTASGRVVANPSSGRMESETTELVLTVTGLKLASPAIGAAWRAGGARAAAPLIADELAGVALGVNPSVIINAPRAIVDVFEAQRVLARLTRQVNAELAANPALAQSVLRPKEYAVGVSSASIAAAQYGNAVERIVADRIASDPALSRVFRHVGGPNNPDFTAFGRNFDITTETRAQVMSHMKRPGYGNDLVVVTYTRPATFRTFTGGQ